MRKNLKSAIFLSILRLSRPFTTNPTALTNAHRSGNTHIKGHEDQGTSFEGFEPADEMYNLDQLFALENYNLSPEDVRSPNFGLHTLNAMYHIIRKTSCAPQQAFEKVKGLNEIEALAVSQYQLEPSQVKDKNLTELQIKGLSWFKLTEQQVTNSSFNDQLLETMLVLYQANPHADKQHIYETALQVDENIAYGLIKGKLTLEQVGITIVDNSFMVQDISNTLSFKLIDLFVALNKNNEAKIIRFFNKLREEKINLETCSEKTSMAFFEKYASIPFSRYPTEKVLKIIVLLNHELPNAEGSYLYSKMKRMYPYQLKAIAYYDFSLKQAGFIVKGNSLLNELFQKSYPITTLIQFLKNNLSLTERGDSKLKYHNFNLILRYIKESKKTLKTYDIEPIIDSLDLSEFYLNDPFLKYYNIKPTKDNLKVMMMLSSKFNSMYSEHLYRQAFYLDFYRKRGILIHGLTFEQVGVHMSVDNSCTGKKSEANTLIDYLQHLQKPYVEVHMGSDCKMHCGELDDILQHLKQTNQTLAENTLEFNNSENTTQLKKSTLSTRESERSLCFLPEKRRYRRC